MIKPILFTLLLAPTMLFAQTEFQCLTKTGPEKELKIPFSFLMPLSGKVFTRSQLTMESVEGVEHYCSVFEITKMFKRIGFMQTYITTLPNGAKITLVENSLENEGPAHFSYGTLTLKGEAAVELNCIKHPLDADL